MKHLLNYVSKPSRYVSLEEIKQKRNPNAVPIALFFNGSYENSICSYGFQSLYQLFNEGTFFTPYRFFLAENDYLDRIQGSDEIISNDDEKQLSELDHFIIYSEEENSLKLLRFLELAKRNKIDILIQRSLVLNPSLEEISDQILLGSEPSKLKNCVKAANDFSSLMSELAKEGKIAHLDQFKGFASVTKFIKPIIPMQTALQSFSYLHSANDSLSADIFKGKSESWESLFKSNQKRLNQAVLNIPNENELSLFPLGISNRLRQINQLQSTYLEIFPTIKKVLAAGWRHIHLYFFLAHPLEEKEDWREFKKEIQAISDFIQLYKKITVHLHFAIYSPSPKSCFLWDDCCDYKNYLKIRKDIEGLLEEKKNFRHYFEPFSNYLSRIVALRCDAKKNEAISSFFRSLNFNFSNFDSLEEHHFDNELFSDLFQAIPLGEALKNIKSDIPLDTLVEDRKNISKLLAEKITDESAELDLKLIKKAIPNLNIHLSKTIDQAAGSLGSEEMQYGRSSKLRASQVEDISKRYRLRFSRKGKLVFYSSPEIRDVFLHFIASAKIPIRMSKGFHPTPKISFSAPSMTGVDLEDEYLDLEVNSIRSVHFAESLNPLLPEGLTILAEKEIPAKTSSLAASINLMEYELTFSEEMFNEGLEHELKNGQYSFIRSSKNSDISLELAPFIHRVEVNKNKIKAQLIAVDNRLLKLEEFLDILQSIQAFDAHSIGLKKTKQFAFKNGTLIDPMNAS